MKHLLLLAILVSVPALDRDCFAGISCSEFSVGAECEGSIPIEVSQNTGFLGSGPRRTDEMVLNARFKILRVIGENLLLDIVEIYSPKDTQYQKAVRDLFPSYQKIPKELLSK